MTARALRGAYFLLPLALLTASLAVPSATRGGVEEGLAVSLLAVKALAVPMVLGGTVLRLAPSSPRQAALTPYLLGLLCGFPTGAQLIGELYGARRISERRANQLLFFSNHCSLPFLLTFLGGQGVKLFLLQLGLTLPFLLSVLLKKEATADSSREAVTLSSALTGSLRRTGETLVFLSVCIIFFTFSVHFICELLRPAPFWESALRLLFELTGGIAQRADTPFFLLAAGVGFGGLSVHAQTAGLLTKAGLSCKSHFWGKVFLGLAMGVAGYFLEKGL